MCHFSFPHLTSLSTFSPFSIFSSVPVIFPLLINNQPLSSLRPYPTLLISSRISWLPLSRVDCRTWGDLLSVQFHLSRRNWYSHSIRPCLVPNGTDLKQDLFNLNLNPCPINSAPGELKPLPSRRVSETGEHAKTILEIKFLNNIIKWCHEQEQK